MTTSTFNGDFARLVPRSHLAQLLFSETFVYVEKKDTFHLRFIDRTGRESDPPDTEPLEDSTEYDTYPDTDAEDPRLRSIQHSGHFVLSFNKSRAPSLPNVGWRVGKGTSKSPANRGVDLLLARPRDVLSKPLASMHMLFRFNLKSGFLMLKAASQKSPVEFKIGGAWEKLEYNKEQLMYQPATMLRVGNCEYELEYTVGTEHREAFFKERAIFLENISPGKDYLQLTFQKLPGDTCVSRGKYLEFGTQGSGAFGWISQGVDTKTGDPIAIKELRIHHRGSRVDVTEEVKFGKRFLVSQIAPVYFL